MIRDIAQNATKHMVFSADFLRKREKIVDKRRTKVYNKLYINLM
jgi:hypothetical protein